MLSTVSSQVVFCWLPSLPLLYLMLIAYNFLGAINFTIEFSYIAITFPAELYGSLIAVTIGVQSLVGFIAWPGLSPSPFEPGDFTPTLLILLLPTPLLLAAPYYEHKHTLAVAAKKSRGLLAALAVDEEQGGESEGGTDKRSANDAHSVEGDAPMLLHVNHENGAL
jgi:hypothetical protein